MNHAEDPIQGLYDKNKDYSKVQSMDDPFAMPDIRSSKGKPDIFSPASSEVIVSGCASLISNFVVPNENHSSSFSAAQPTAQAPGAAMEPFPDDDEDQVWDNYSTTDEDEFSDNDLTGEVIGYALPNKIGPAFIAANGEVIGPNHSSVPQSMNTMHKYRDKEAVGKDPNGRFSGRGLIMWHRPRMMDKLVLHIQYECHLAKIKLPWDKIAHRLSPGSSGPAIIQYLNKSRDVLVAEGHMIPPNMGKSKAVYDPSIRGYVRDMNAEIPTHVRLLPWNERYEDKKVSLEVPGLVRGSGKYDRNKANRVTIPKETGRRSRVPVEIKDQMAAIREKKNVKPAKSRVKVNTRTPKAKNKDNDEDEIEEIDSVDLDSDDDYEPTFKSSNKRKVKGSSTGRGKKSRAKFDFDDENSDDEDNITPVKSGRQGQVKSASGSVGSKAMASLSIETPTKQRSSSRQRAHTSGVVMKREDYKIPIAIHGADEDPEHDEGQTLHHMSSVKRPNTPPFGATPLDIQDQVEAGYTPPYSQSSIRTSSTSLTDNAFDYQASSMNPLYMQYTSPDQSQNSSRSMSGGSYSNRYSGQSSTGGFSSYAGSNRLAFGGSVLSNPTSAINAVHNTYVAPIGQSSFGGFGGFGGYSGYGGSSGLFDPSFDDFDDSYLTGYNNTAANNPGYSNQYDDPRFDKENIKPHRGDNHLDGSDVNEN